MSAEDACTVCRTDRYIDASLRLLVSACGHRACETCVNRLWSAGAGPCPVCGTALRRHHWVHPVFGDTAVEREVRVRKQLGPGVLARPAGDFASAREHDDYLERMEEVVAELVADRDLARVSARIEALRREAAARTRARSEAASMPDVAHVDYEQRILEEIEQEHARAEAAESSYIDALADESRAPTAARPKRAKTTRDALSQQWAKSYSPTEGVSPLPHADDAAVDAFVRLVGIDAGALRLMAAGGLSPSLLAALCLSAA